MTKPSWGMDPRISGRAIKDIDHPDVKDVHCGRCRRWIAVYVGGEGAAVWLRNGKGQPLFVDSFKEGTFSVRCKRCRRMNIVDSKTGDVLRTVDS